MSRTDSHFETAAQRLKAVGADPIRLSTLQVAARFKRSWLDMAQALLRLRDTNEYERWGFPDLYSYCENELLIKRATVDKLLLSYLTIERHKPEVLTWDGVEQRIPAYDTVEYLGRALGERFDDEEPPERRYDDDRVDQLKHAIFDEGRPLAALRKEFNPVFFAKSEEEQELTVIERAHASAKRLESLLPKLPGLSKAKRRSLEIALAELREALETQLPRARARTVDVEN